jgi:hypothetical protein
MAHLTEYKDAINDKALIKKFTQDQEKHCLKRLCFKNIILIVYFICFMFRWLGTF